MSRPGTRAQAVPSRARWTWRGRRSGAGLVALAWLCGWLSLALVAAGPVRAQDGDTDPPADATSDAAGDTTTTPPPMPPGTAVQLQYEPKAGVKANVQQYTYYGNWLTTATFARGATARQTFDWTWSDFRKQEKTVEERKAGLNYNFGKLLPLVTTVNGSWNWSEDRTTNSAGYANLFKLDNKLVSLNSSAQKFQRFGLMNSLNLSANYTEQASENQNLRNDFSEGTAAGNAQSGWAVTRGVIVIGRVAGTTTSGTRLLGAETSPSSALGDSLGVGVYVNRSLGSGYVQMTRSNFEKKYLEFRRNANGLVDTVGVPEAQKIVNEIETRDALSLDMEYKVDLGPLSGSAKLTHTTDDQDFAINLQGLKQRAADTADVKLSCDAGSDSLSVSWQYGLRWDDQRIKDATSSRGRQYAQERDFQANWDRRIFRATMLGFQYHEGLTQDIAEGRFNENDKDRLQRDFSARIDRAWAPRFTTKMVFSYRQSQDISIRGGSSSNNNVKDSYELTPGYTWQMAPWFTLQQNYRVYIQYTDYLYSYLPTVTRKDDYNKRGDVTTQITVIPNDRLTVTLRHDFNRRFNATKASEDATGAAFYHRDLEQDIAKIDLSLVYKVTPGVTLETTTYRTRDDKTSLGRTTTSTRTDSGQLIVGARVDHIWGTVDKVEVSAMVRKVNAYGPSITATSSDYWEADTWLKWTF